MGDSILECPILYFGNDWDAENRTSSHQMALRLSGHCDLIYIECPGLRRPSGSTRDLRKLVDKVRKTLRGVRTVGNMRVYTLFQLPFHGNALARRINRALVMWQVGRIRRLFGKRRPVLWFVIPHLPYVPRLLPDLTSVYYCIDKFAALPGVDAAAVAQMDEQLTRDASVVFVASEKLLEDKRRIRADVLLSPHGVDFDHFSVATEPGERPPELSAWRGKIVGFWGLIEAWIDLELLAQIARQRPEWLVVLIGHQAVDVSALRVYPNVLLVGKKTFAELPKYARHFDVGILPYRLTEQVIHSNPIKLREYLATGKPVVSVRFPHAERFADVIYLADNRDEFIARLDDALAEDDTSARRRRIGGSRIYVGCASPHGDASGSGTHDGSRLGRRFTNVSPSSEMNHLLFSTLYRAYEALRGRPMLRYLREYERNQWLSADQLRELQTRKLRALVGHAEREVPHFKTVLKARGLRAADIRGPEDLSLLPIMTKQEVRAEYDSFIATSHAGKNYRKATGGSTGDPFQFECDMDSEYRRLAVMWRGYRWGGGDLGSRSAYIWSWPYAGKTGWTLFKEKAYQRLFGRTFFSVFDLSEKTLPKIAGELRKLRPEFIVCYVSGGVAVGEWLLAHGERIPAPRGVITGAEPLHASQRDVLEKAFGAPVFNTYGGREFMLMGAECPAHEGLHISADHLLIETVDDAGNAVVGKPGRVLVTDLHNFGMPFLRYANGDLATLASHNCSCGRGLPLFESIDGREAELVPLPDGRRLPSLYFVHILKDYSQIRYFQVVQTQLNEFLIQIVPTRPEVQTTFEYEDKLRAELGNVRIRSEVVRDIPLTKSGKRRVFVSKLVQTANVT